MISTKKVNGKDTGTPCITVLVREKISRPFLIETEVVPQSVDDVPTDVVESGEIRKVGIGKQGKLRPAPRGASIGHYHITAGTFGALVYGASGAFILSNNHVLADENRGKLGDPILQPGPYDGGQTSTDRIGTLYKFIPVTFPGSAPSECSWAKSYVGFGNWIGELFGKKTGIPARVSIDPVRNKVDCALALPDKASDLDDQAFEGDHTPTGTVDATIGQAVFKTGRTTCFTNGSVIGLDATIDVGYDQGTATYEGQIVLGPGMSQGGDSGSLVQEKDTDKAVGLLFAGSDRTTIVNPINLVLDALGVSIL